GRGNRPGIKRHRAQRELASELAARRTVPHPPRPALPASFARYVKLLILAALIAAAIPALAAEKILAARVWPAQEYTRVTFEAARAMKHQMFFVQNPDRLVVDLDGIELNDELKALPSKVGAADPYIAAVRVGINRPNVVRVVF